MKNRKFRVFRNVNLGKSNWQITGYPASLRKIDAEALNCNLHPKIAAIELFAAFLSCNMIGLWAMGKCAPWKRNGVQVI